MSFKIGEDTNKGVCMSIWKAPSFFSASMGNGMIGTDSCARIWGLQNKATSKNKNTFFMKSSVFERAITEDYMLYNTLRPTFKMIYKIIKIQLLLQQTE